MSIKRGIRAHKTMEHYLLAGTGAVMHLALVNQLVILKRAAACETL